MHSKNLGEVFRKIKNRKGEQYEPPQSSTRNSSL